MNPITSIEDWSAVPLNNEWVTAINLAYRNDIEKAAIQLSAAERYARHLRDDGVYTEHMYAAEFRKAELRHTMAVNEAKQMRQKMLEVLGVVFKQIEE